MLALKNLFDALAPGGYLMTSVPNLNHGHMLPIYFSMPTPWGLALWCKMAGFEPLHTGQFGNRQYVHPQQLAFSWQSARRASTSARGSFTRAMVVLAFIPSRQDRSVFARAV